METITLTLLESNAVCNIALTDAQRYFIWCGILALRGENIPQTDREVPKYLQPVERVNSHNTFNYQLRV